MQSTTKRSFKHHLIYSLLQQQEGNPLTTSQIAHITKIHTSEIDNIISDLHNENSQICTDARGHYYSESSVKMYIGGLGILALVMVYPIFL